MLVVPHELAQRRAAELAHVEEERMKEEARLEAARIKKEEERVQKAVEVEKNKLDQRGVDVIIASMFDDAYRQSVETCGEYYVFCGGFRQEYTYRFHGDSIWGPADWHKIFRDCNIQFALQSKVVHPHATINFMHNCDRCPRRSCFRRRCRKYERINVCKIDVTLPNDCLVKQQYRDEEK